MTKRTSLPDLYSLIAVFILSAVPIARGQDALPANPEPDWAAIEQSFRDLPLDARRLTGPLFWLHGDESQERLEMYVEKVAEGGNGCFTAESRPHVDWLGDGWYRDLDICLEAAKKHGLKMWIFDEKWWPSGEVGGKVPVEYSGKRLVADAAVVDGPRPYSAPGFAAPEFIGAVAGLELPDGIDGTSLVDLAPFIQDGVLTWDVPQGKWQIIRFTWKPSGGHLLVDGASQNCVDWYIQTVYQPHFDRFKNDFGKDIMGYFYDEPETHADWGTEVMKVLAERGIDWKKALVSFKLTLAGEEQAAAQYQYRDAFAQAWGRTLYGGISKWCRDHGVLSIGHFLEHRDEYLNPELCAGDMIALQKYSDMGGIDAVFDQFVMGKRDVRDHPTWQTPKLGSSITHMYNKPDDITMVEIFGARGQDLSYPEMKWWTDHMHVSGVNFLIPHSFNPRAPYDTDCPPYFYNGGFEPRWPLYRLFADYTSRLSVILTGGRHVCPVALLYLGQSKQVGNAIAPAQISESLQDALFDCDWMPYEVFENDATLTGNAVSVFRESFRILIVPPVEVIPYNTLEKVRLFFDQGGIVVGHGFLPTKSATLGKTSADIAALCDVVWGAPQPGLGVCKTNDLGGRSYLLPEKPTPEELQQVLTGDAGVHPTLEVLEGDTGHWLHVLHRVKSGRDVFFITNQNHEGDPRSFHFRITAPGEPECWDAMRNEISKVSYTRNGGQVDIAMTFEPLESVLLVFQPEARPLPLRIEHGKAQERLSIAVVRDEVPPVPEPTLDVQTGPAERLKDCPWVWIPGEDALNAAEPGTRYLRKTIAVPEDRNVTSASFIGLADNRFTLFVNGQPAGTGDSWQTPAEMDITALLQPGANTLAIAALNGGEQPNPAGVMGALTVAFDAGQPQTERVDAAWKAATEAPDGWNAPAFDDAAWAAAHELGSLGAGPWGVPGTKLTLSPVKANPFAGHFDISDSIDIAQSRVFLEVDQLAPEAAARVFVNGNYAGGFIGRPLRLDVSKLLQPGANTLAIEPFAPELVRLVIYEP